MKTIPLTKFQFWFILLFSVISISIECYIHAVNPVISLLVCFVSCLFMVILLIVRLIIFLETRVKFK